MKFKSFFLFCSVVGICGVTNGQGFALGKGASMITGTGSISSSSSSYGSNTETERISFITISPSIDYFIFDHLFVEWDKL